MLFPTRHHPGLRGWAGYPQTATAALFGRWSWAPVDVAAPGSAAFAMEPMASHRNLRQTDTGMMGEDMVIVHDRGGRQGQLSADLDILWLLFGAYLGFFMQVRGQQEEDAVILVLYCRESVSKIGVVFGVQCGFALLEAGAVRAKNTKNILLKVWRMEEVNAAHALTRR